MQNDHIKLHKQMAKKSPDTTITVINWNVDLKPLNFGQLANHNLSCGEGMPTFPQTKLTKDDTYESDKVYGVFVRESTMGMEVPSLKFVPVLASRFCL